MSENRIPSRRDFQRAAREDREFIEHVRHQEENGEGFRRGCPVCREICNENEN